MKLCNKLMGMALALVLAVMMGCASSLPPAVGVWGVEMNTPLGPLDATLTLNADGTGSMSTPELGEAPIDGITYDGAAVVFEAEVDVQGQSIVLEFDGTVTGDDISGGFSSDFGEFAVTGTRSSSIPASQ